MKNSWQWIKGSVTSPAGFQAAGVYCHIKTLGTGKGSDHGKKRDLAVLFSEIPATVAGTFTTNQVKAAPVLLCLQRLRQSRAQAIVMNSGNANACTGSAGLADAEAMAQCTAEALDLKATDVLVCSTGRIGVRLPMGNVRQGITDACAALSSSRRHAGQAAEAIMTSDTVRKEAAVRYSIGPAAVTLGGMAKGAGMIQPGMSRTGRRPAASALHATMLGFLTTDARVSRPILQRSLELAVAQSFNRITVDGDMSTNDSVLLLANGRSEASVIDRWDSPEQRAFQVALNELTLKLAHGIVRDGEGISRFVTVRVRGARSPGEADAAARAVANSALVKTSWCGGDPNWGRIMDALGYSSAQVVPEKVDIAYATGCNQALAYALKSGTPTEASLNSLRRITRRREFLIEINLNLGPGENVVYASDLTEEYVDFNKGE